MAIIHWNKLYTETLSDTLDRFRRENPEFLEERVTYAGRLDPMAEGILLLLTGNDVHKKDDFLGLDKTYEVDFVFGPKTDTDDILGMVSSTSSGLEKVKEEILINILLSSIGKKEQAYHSFSSKPVSGKPLFKWARENRLHEIDIPIKQINIYKIEYLGCRKVSKDIFMDTICVAVNKVNGDFRQDDICRTWRNFFTKTKEDSVFIYSIRVHASSGTYMRSLIKEIGDTLGIPACSLKISRVKIGTLR